MNDEGIQFREITLTMQKLILWPYDPEGTVWWDLSPASEIITQAFA